MTTKMGIEEEGRVGDKGRGVGNEAWELEKWSTS